MTTLNATGMEINVINSCGTTKTTWEEYSNEEDDTVNVQGCLKNCAYDFDADWVTDSIEDDDSDEYKNSDRFIIDDDNADDNDNDVDDDNDDNNNDEADGRKHDDDNTSVMLKC